MRVEELPDEITIRRTIADRIRELRTLRAIERALARHRRDTAQAAELAKISAGNVALRDKEVTGAS